MSYNSTELEFLRSNHLYHKTIAYIVLYEILRESFKSDGICRVNVEPKLRLGGVTRVNYERMNSLVGSVRCNRVDFRCSNNNSTN